MNNIYDVIIIGSGPGGLSAGIYSARSKLKTLIIEKNLFGGQILNTGVIENYPGSIEDETGASLAKRMIKQCEKFGAEFIKDKVLDIELNKEIKTIKCKNNTYKTKSVIIATGCKHKNLNVDREDEFLGRGLSYCAICDGHLFEDLHVYVAGGGESAVKESLYLSKFAKKVTILSKYDELKCSGYIEEKCREKDNIEIINNVKIIELLGRDVLNGIKVKNLKTNEESVFIADEDDEIIGLFVFVGLKSQTDLFKGLLNLDEKGYIKTDENMKTNIDGVYAIGDCRSKDLRQVITACNDGAIETFEEEVLKYKGKVVVEFWSETCQPCKELLPGVEALSKKYNKSMKFCDIDTKRAPRIAIKQKVLSLPVIRIYEDGKILDETSNGDVTIEKIENMIKKFV